MKNALLVVSGVSIGLLGALVAVASNRSVLPQAEAQTAQSDAGGCTVVMGTGGATNNTNDLCWLFFKEKAKDRSGKEFERYSLCLYKAVKNGETFDLVGERDVTYDMKATHLPSNFKSAFPPKELKDAWERALKKEQEEANRPPPRNP
jgi:hypothetical protein